MPQERRETILWLGEHFATAWSSERCPVELKKRLVRAVIREIVVDATDTSIAMTVHWQGGDHTQLQTERPNLHTTQANSADDIEIIRQLAPRYSDDQIGRVLSRMGRRTGKGRTWSRQAVKSARNKAGITGGDHPTIDPNLLSLQGAARHLGVSDTTIRRMVEAGLVENHQAIPWAPWEVCRQDLEAQPVADAVACLRRTGRLVLDPHRFAELAEQLPLFHGGSNDG